MNVGLFFISTIVCLAILELFLFYQDFVPNHPCIFTSHARAGWIMKPHSNLTHQTSEYTMHIQSDALGLRNTGVDYTRKTLPRIVFLGDSFTYGIGVDGNDTFSALIEKKLRGKNKNVQTINAGVGGYGTEQEFLLLQSHVDTFQPDAVVLGFFLGNDFEDNEINWRKFGVNEEGCIVSKTKDENGSFSLIGVIKSSRIVQVSYTIANQLQFISIEHEELRQKTHPALKRYTVDANFDEVKFENTQQYIRKTNAFLQARNIPFFVMLIPEKRATNEKELFSILEGRGYASDEILSLNPQDFLLSLCAEESIPCLDLTPSFREETAYKQFFFPKDGHYTEEGHALTAEIATDFLIRFYFDTHA